MTKLKINVSFEVEEDPRWYDEGTTPEDILTMEISNFLNDPGAVMEAMSNGSIVDVTGEILER